MHNDISFVHRTDFGCFNDCMGPTVEACTSRALPDYKSAILLPSSHKSKKMLPRKRDTCQSHAKGPFSGLALTIMSFDVEGLSAAKEQLIADLRQ